MEVEAFAKALNGKEGDWLRSLVVVSGGGVGRN